LKVEIDQALAALKAAVGGENISAIHSTMARLTAALQKLQGIPKHGQTGETADPTDAGMVDAEFEEVSNPNRKAS
jgi:hypothetical protein